jgi:transposase
MLFIHRSEQHGTTARESSETGRSPARGDGSYQGRVDGSKGLVIKVSTGRPKKLELRDLKKLQKIILCGPMKAGFANELWTSKRVLQVIKREFDIDYHANHLPKLLRSLGFLSFCNSRPIQV